VSLRQRLRKLERLSRAAIGGDKLPWGALRAEGESFFERLARHMVFEDRYLTQALLVADSWGEQRAAQFRDEHREQREFLAYVLDQLRDEQRPERLIAANLLDLIELLRRDMEEEESVFLDPRVLRNDVVAIDAFSG
jgi:hypothetical protein